MKRSITAKITVFAAVTFILLSFIGAMVYQHICEQIDAGQRLSQTQRYSPNWRQPAP